MPKYYYCVPHTKEVGSYTEAEGITDFPRGVFLAYGNCCLVTGFKTRKEAEEGIKKYPCKNHPLKK
jgi:hypothetical protein